MQMQQARQLARFFRLGKLIYSDFFSVLFRWHYR